MRDIVITDIPQEHYDGICEEAAKLGISADDYLSILFKGYAIGLKDKDLETSKTSK
jgi:hypothetical protein